MKKVFIVPSLKRQTSLLKKGAMNVMSTCGGSGGSGGCSSCTYR